MATININQLQIELFKGSNNAKIKRAVREYVVPVYEQAHREMMEEFESHPVTLELDAGPSDGNGSLYGFIGFDKEQPDPIDVLRSELSFATLGNVRIERRGIIYKFIYNTNIPTFEALAEKTPMPWERGRSWIVGIEKGISGFSHYLYKKYMKGSRSGDGIQVKGNVSHTSIRFQRQSYMSKILNNFQRKIGGL